MPLRKLKPITPGTRFYSISTFEEITKSKPERSLLAPLKKSGGRNNTGRITSRHRGGGHKRRYRIIDFKRNKAGNARVEAIEYDPNRSCRIALLKYEDGELRYILSPATIKVGDTLQSGVGAEIRDGNALPLGKIPVGSFIHNIEMKPGKGGQIARSAGAAAQLVARDEKYAQVKLPSSEVRLIPIQCIATLGQLGNADNENISYGKAGRMIWLGVRPQTRGMAMNPVDHPMGGGEGRASGGHPRSRKGIPSKGLKTRSRTKASNALIVSRKKKS